MMSTIYGYCRCITNETKQDIKRLIDICNKSEKLKYEDLIYSLSDTVGKIT